MTRGFLRFVRGNAVAMLALFIALTGTTYAASTALIGKNTVASPQVVNGSLQTKDLSGKARKALKGNRGLRGLTGAAGAAGAAGARGATGPKGADYTVATTLQSGQTETGVYAAWGQASAAGGYLADAVSFRIPLAADLPAANQHFVTGASAPNCPGIGQAAAGHLCLYRVAFGNTTWVNTFDPTTGGNGISKVGFNAYFTFAAAGAGWNYGEWAVTAP